MIRVMVVEDSPLIQEFLVHVLSSDPAIQVVGIARSGEEALEVVARTRPDVITMDIHLPKMDGFDTTRRIMETNPTPIVIVSGSWNPQEVSGTFRAMEAGALAALPRPQGAGHPEHKSTTGELIQTVKLMSEVKVVRRWARLRPGVTVGPPALEEDFGRRPVDVRVVAVGTSTGGPLVLRTILSGLPKDFSVPLLIVQHMAAGFIRGFADWLAQDSRLPIHVAANGEHTLPGHVYLAPDDFQMTVGMGGRIILTKDEPEYGLRPSVSCLFRSVKEVYGQNAVGVLLTGMGKDGAEELRLMKEKGAITIAQDEESSVVHGMPGEAISLGAVNYVLSPERIVAALGSWLGDKKGR